MPAVVDHPAGSVVELGGGGRGRGPACLDVDGHVGAMMFDRLERPDRLSELHPFPAVGGGGLEGPLGHTRSVGSRGNHPEGEHPVEQCGGGRSGWAQQVVRAARRPLSKVTENKRRVWSTVWIRWQRRPGSAVSTMATAGSPSSPRAATTRKSARSASSTNPDTPWRTMSAFSATHRTLRSAMS